MDSVSLQCSTSSWTQLLSPSLPHHGFRFPSLLYLIIDSVSLHFSILHHGFRFPSLLYLPSWIPFPSTSFPYSRRHFYPLGYLIMDSISLYFIVVWQQHRYFSVSCNIWQFKLVSFYYYMKNKYDGADIQVADKTSCRLYTGCFL
jgi:hypothetical protein